MNFEYKIFIFQRELRILQCHAILRLCLSMDMEFNYLDHRQILNVLKDYGIDYPLMGSDIIAASLFIDEFKHNPFLKLELLNWMKDNTNEIDGL